MVKLIPKRTFLLRQDDVEGGKKKDVVAKKGEMVAVNEKEAIKFWGDFQMSEGDKKKLLDIARIQKLQRQS